MSLTRRDMLQDVAAGAICFQNLRWDEVNQRLARAQKAAKILAAS